MQRELEEERQRRVDHLQRMAGRRLLRKDLSRGWTAWFDGYQEQTHRARVLRGAGSRFVRPKLVASYNVWRRDWEIAEAARISSERVLSRTSALSHQERATSEAALTAMSDELSALREALARGEGEELAYRQQVARTTTCHDRTAASARVHRMCTRP